MTTAMHLNGEELEWLREITFRYGSDLLDLFLDANPPEENGFVTVQVDRSTISKLISLICRGTIQVSEFKLRSGIESKVWAAWVDLGGEK